MEANLAKRDIEDFCQLLTEMNLVVPVFHFLSCIINCDLVIIKSQNKICRIETHNNGFEKAAYLDRMWTI